MKKIMSKKNSIHLRIAYDSMGEQIFKALLNHPMEDGYRRDKKTGKMIPADYIEDFRISVDEEDYFAMRMGKNVSKNPFVSFTFAAPLFDNQRMNISWTDNHKREISYDLEVDFSQNGVYRYTGGKKGSEIVQTLPETGPVCKTKSYVATD